MERKSPQRILYDYNLTLFYYANKKQVASFCATTFKAYFGIDYIMSPEKRTESNKKPDLTIEKVDNQRAWPVIFVEAKKHGSTQAFCEAMLQVANAVLTTLGEKDWPAAHVLVIKGYDFAFFEYHVQTQDDIGHIPNYMGLIPMNQPYWTYDNKEYVRPRVDFSQYKAKSITYDLANRSEVSNLHLIYFFFTNEKQEIKKKENQYARNLAHKCEEKYTNGSINSMECVYNLQNDLFLYHTVLSHIRVEGKTRDIETL